MIRKYMEKSSIKGKYEKPRKWKVSWSFWAKEQNKRKPIMEQ